MRDGHGEHEGQQRHSRRLLNSGAGGAIGAIEEGFGELGDDGAGLGRPWANSEDVSYFLFKVVVGNALVLMDCVIAAR